MESLEKTLFRFWSQCVACLRQSTALTGGHQTTEAYLRGYYSGLRDLLGHPPGPELEFPHYPAYLEGEEPDELLLAQEHWIAERIFENELVAFWTPEEDPPIDLSLCSPESMWLDFMPGRLWGRVYKKPLRPDRPIEKMALESTLRALNQQSVKSFQPIESRAPFVTSTGYRAFTTDDFNAMTGNWPALASAAKRQGRESTLRTAAENSSDPRVWAWYALERVTNTPYLSLDEETRCNLERWSVLKNLRLYDPDNGAADILEAYLCLRMGLIQKSVTNLMKAFRRGRMTFYPRDFWDLLWSTSCTLGWTLEQTRHLVMGSSALLLKPIGLFRKELASNKRAQSALTKLAHQEMYQPLLMQQILGCSLLQAIDPDSLMVRRFRERSDNNLDFIRRIKHEQITEERWERYYDDVINRSENEAIESLRDEGYVPLGTSESWLEDILAATTGQEDPSPL